MNRPGDLTVAVEAGITLGDLNRELSAHGQLLPLDPSSGDRATIGGLLAKGESGPLRHRFGAPRDLVIGIQLATTDGRITKAGGQVVKNVAGYDLSKLMSGSFGSLAAITGATFKLAPLPGASATVFAEGLDTGALVRLAGAAAASQLEPVAFDFQAAHGIPDGPRGASCAMRFWSFAAAIGPQVDAARACFASAGAEGVAIAGEDETRLWVRQAGGLNDGEGAIARVSWLPSELASMLQLLERLGGRGPVAMTGRIGAASGFIRIGGSESIQIAALEELRRTPPARHLVVVRASRAVKAAVDVWGVVPNAGLLDAIKRTLDPARILGAGRGPL
jgi:glycolate oxidase FAD binding subunit